MTRLAVPSWQEGRQRRTSSAEAEKTWMAVPPSRWSDMTSFHGMATLVENCGLWKHKRATVKNKWPCRSEPRRSSAHA